MTDTRVVENVPITLHLASGKEVGSYIECFSDEDPEDELDGLIELLSHRPHWRSIGDVLVFTGAVSAISLTLEERTA